MKFRPQLLPGSLKVLNLRPRSSSPVELCSLHHEKRGEVEERGCSSFHIPPTMQLPIALCGLSCMGNLAVSFLWSFLVLTC